jgi:hypothetical protein
MLNEGRFLHRLVLDRLLGAGTFRLTQSSGDSSRHDMLYGCGCRATERDPDRYEVFACLDHDEAVAREGAGGT